MRLRNSCGSESSASSTTSTKCSRFILHPLPRHLRQAPPIPPTDIEDCRELCRCRVRLRALYLALRLKPIVQLVTVCPSALLVKFVGALLNLLLNRDQEGRLVRLRCEC